MSTTAEAVRVRLLSKELYRLYVRVKAIHAICGGSDDDAAAQAAAAAQGASPFDAAKSALIAHLAQVDDLIAARDSTSASVGERSRDAIRLRVTVENELRDVGGELQALSADSASELRKRKGVTAPEIAARRAVLQACTDAFHATFKRAKGYEAPGVEASTGGGAAAAAAIGINVMTREQLESGKYRGAGMRAAPEAALTTEQQAQLQAVRAEHAAQDAVLDEIDAGLDALKDMAEKIGEELQLQDRMIEDVGVKTDKAQDKLDAVNERTKDVLRKMNDKSSRICLYLICFAILGAIAVVLYNMIRKG